MKKLNIVFVVIVIWIIGFYNYSNRDQTPPQKPYLVDYGPSESQIPETYDEINALEEKVRRQQEEIERLEGR